MGKRLKIKRYIVLTIIFVMIFTTTVMAKEDIKQVGEENYVIVSQNENGQFVKSENKEVDLSKNQYIATVELDSDIYKLEDERYLLDTGTDFYQLVERFEFNLIDKENLIKLLLDINVEKEVKDSLINASNKAISQKNFEAKTVLYIPALLDTKGTLTSYYTYNGYDCKDILVYNYNVSTGYEYVKVGSSTWAVAQGVYDLVILGVGSVSPELSLFIGAVSAATHFMNETQGTVASGHYTDFLQVKVVYDNYQKYTSVDKGYGYQIGATTHKIYLKTTDTYEYHFAGSNGTEAYSNKTINKTYKTQYYDTPASFATTHVYPLVESLSFEVDSLTVDFWY
ncbi:MAG TPA: hypothetical protein DDX29_11830 [Clostridiales bacterium]|nr:hypothetical protein [Clostridiales bacterium]